MYNNVDNLLKKVSIDKGCICIETEQLENHHYAFYLVHGNDVKKLYYSSKNIRKFDVRIEKKLHYKIIAFYKNLSNGSIQKSSIEFSCTDSGNISILQKNVFIYGGCVSRDIFTKDFDKNSSLNVVDYYARYSIAKLTADSYIGEIDLSAISSSFQKRMIYQDLRNDIFTALLDRKYDVFLVDLLTIRLNLAKYDNTILTCSNELISSGFLENRDVELITPNNERYWELWEAGFNKLVSFLRENNLLKKLLIQKLYWATVDENGEILNNQNIIEQQNKLLARAYSIVEKHIGDTYFIEYSESEFIAAKEHKWGKSPIHYIDNLYMKAFSQIKNYQVK